MDWEEKLQRANAEAEVNEELEWDVEVSGSGAPEGFISEVLASYPYAPKSYLRFLEITDGAEIGSVRIFGSGTSEFAGLKDANEWYSEVYPADQWLPVACDAGGYPFLVTASGAVVAGDAKSSTPKTEPLASSFEEFLCETIMGSRYTVIYPGVEEDPECEWYRFLVRMGWAGK